MYWTAEYTGNVKSAPLETGKPVTIHVRGQTQPESVQVGLQGIYWKNLNAPVGVFSVPFGSVDSPVTTEVTVDVAAFLLGAGSLVWATTGLTSTIT